MGSMSIWHWLIVLVVVLLLFGAGKIPKLMGDMAKGVKAFKQGLNDMNNDDKPADNTTPPTAAAPGTIPPPPADIKKDTAKV
jgi:sec-independent protein translocase protein TatA